MNKIPEELKVKLEKIATENNVLILSFIAPDAVLKVSPTSFSYASIENKDIYNLEKTIEEMKENASLPDKLHLIIQTPGGALSTSFKIANYQEIQVFIPYEASSGGTLMCLAANKITMSDFANLTPIDPQVIYKGERVSAYRIIEAVDSFQKKFGETRPLDIPPPWQQMGEKFDPIIYHEMDTSVWQSIFYASRLLKKSGYPEKESTLIAVQLARTAYSHGHCIDSVEAKEIGLNICNDEKSLALLKEYKNYLSIRLKETVDYHIIESFAPQKDKKDAENTAVEKKSETIKSPQTTTVS